MAAEQENNEKKSRPDLILLLERNWKHLSRKWSEKRHQKRLSHLEIINELIHRKKA